MVALTEALAPEFGAAKIFRPYRDVRFAKDKTPYKTHQGAYVAVAPATGWYVEIERPGRAGGFAVSTTRRVPTWPGSATPSPTSAPAPSSRSC